MLVAVVSLVGVLFVACVFALAIALAIVVAVGALLRGAITNFVATRGGWRSKFLIAFIPFMFLLCLAAVRFLPAQSGTVSSNSWHTRTGPALLFLGLLPLVNAPFDWLSLGLTRLLLRFGIEQGGPWPWVLALIDAVIASLLITLLAVAMVDTADLFNYLAELGGGEKARVLPPMQFYLAALRSTPRATEFWWLYATLFSTMLPSIINLFIAGFSFLRSLPSLRAFLLRAMRPCETMPAGRRFAAALILTLQTAFAAIFAIGAQAFLGWIVLWRFLPWLGGDILEIAEKFAM